jgi:hypothetical protein
MRGRGTCGAYQMRRADRVDLQPVGSRQAMFLTTQRLLITCQAEPPLCPTFPCTPGRAAARNYDAAIDDLARHAGLAA